MIRIMLSTLLGERRLSQAELSRMTGVRQMTINDLYHEFCERVTLDHLDRICEALDCDISELITRVPNKIPLSERIGDSKPHK